MSDANQGVRNDISPRKDIGPRNDISPRKDLKVGSRPPPQKRPSTSSLSILFIMGFVVAAAFVASGNLVPVDPNGPKGPPTLGPYYNPADYPKQQIVMPTGADANYGAKKNLQLKTFDVDTCGENMALVFLIDTSGSMQYVNKLGKTKQALRYFVSKMGGKSVIGMDTFSKDVKTLVPISFYKDVKPLVAKEISALPASGWTRTKDGMELVEKQLKQAIENEDFPGYKFNLVLMTDGVPELPSTQPRTCYFTTYDPNLADHVRCFTKEEDPTVPRNIPTDLKNLGVDIYTVNVYSPSYQSDAVLFPHLDGLLKRISSTPLNTHYFVSTNADNLGSILKSVQDSICYNNFNGTKPVAN